MIQIFHVSKYYGKNHPALEDVTFHVEKGEFVYITGPNGSGKTTLLRLIVGDESPDEGQILVQGRNTGRLTPSSLPYLRRHIGFIFQDYRLLVHKTVFDNVALSLKVLGTPRKEMKRKVQEALSVVGLTHQKDTFPVHLSSGEQQRVCIARALAPLPPVLLADEPTGNMDHDLSSEIIRLLSHINQKGTTVVVATHHKEMIKELPKRTVILEKGRIVKDSHEGPL